MVASHLPKLKLRLNQSGVEISATKAYRSKSVITCTLHKVDENAGITLTPESKIVSQMQQYKQVRLDEKLLNREFVPTQHGGRARIKSYLGNGLFLSVSGTAMENIGGVLYDLKWSGVGREFIRQDGRRVKV